MIRFLIFFSFLFSTLRANFPQKLENVDLFVDLSLAELKQRVEEVMKIPDNERNFNNTILAWDEIGTIFFSKAALLKYMENEAGAFQKICLAFNEMITKKEIHEALIGFVEKSSSLKPSERYYLRSFQKSSDDLPYTEAFGREKKEFNGKLSIANWNVCMLPGQMSLIFGGILPWEKRIEGVICLLKKVDPDIICLQEVFDRKAALQLYEALKSRYAVFYYNISPRNLGLSPNSVGLSSGLFVASKYPIEAPKFEKFEKIAQPVIDRGFFSFEMGGISFVTTHLEATLKGLEEPDQFRKYQIEQILKTKPSIICGDLNITWGKNEPAEGLLKQVYQDPYNEGRVSCTFENCTHCDYTQRTPQILDYLLVSKEKKMAVKTEVLSVGTPENPECALSDHHLQLSTIELK